MSARLNIQIIQQQPLNTLLLFLPPRCHRAAPPIVRRRFIPRGKMVSLLLQFQQCTVRHSCCCTQFQPAVHCARTLHWWWWNCCCSAGKFTQDWDLWAALGQLAQQGGGRIALFLHPNPAALLHLHARVACFTCITWTVRLPLASFSISYLARKQLSLFKRDLLFGRLQTSKVTT